MIYSDSLYLCIIVPLFAIMLFVKNKIRRACWFLIVGISLCLVASNLNSLLMQYTGFSIDEMAIYITPISEELIKFFPIGIYFLLFDPEKEEMLIASVLIGGGFAIFENLCLLLQTGNGDILDICIRCFSVGIMHIGCMLIVGMGLVLFRQYERMKMIGILGILAATMTYHAVYNLLVSVRGISLVVGYSIPIITLLFFYFMKKKAERREKMIQIKTE